MSALVIGCGPALFHADLQPAAQKNGPPIGVIVSAAGVTEDLLWSAEFEGDADSAIVLRVHVQNQTGAARALDLAQFRLSLSGAGGRVVTRECTAAGRGEMPSSVKTHRLPPLSLAPGQIENVWLIFAGFNGLPLTSAARIELLVPGEAPGTVVPLALATPAAPSPTWVLWRSGGTFALRAGYVGTEAASTTSIGFQSSLALGRFVVGLNNTFENVHIPESIQVNPTDPRGYHTIGLGLFAGGFVARFVGLIAGVDAMSAFARSVDESQEDRDGYLLRAHAALRFSTGHSGAYGGGAVAVQHRRPFRLRTYNLDVGYAHSFATRAIPSGGGVLVMFSAPMFAF